MMGRYLPAAREVGLARLTRDLHVLRPAPA